MLTGIINRLRGQVRIRAESAFPERILNLCGARELAFWDVTWESPTAFTCRLSARRRSIWTVSSPWWAGRGRPIFSSGSATGRFF